MLAKKIFTQFIYLAIAIVLFSACTAPQSQSQSPNTPQVKPLTRLSPTNTKASTAPTSLKNAIRQIIYVPAYSHVYYGNGKEYLLAITLSIRNTSLTDSISVTSVRYYNSNGKLVKEYFQKSFQLPPMATTEFFVEEQDQSGGSGANFIVEWAAQKGVTEPVVEAVMISTAFQQGISLISPGRVIEQKSE